MASLHIPRFFFARVIRQLFVALTATALLVRPSAAQQVSIVPAAHGVYDWLWSQRIWGRLPTYDHEIRPTARGVILGHLHTLARDSVRLSYSDRALLRDYVNEFDFDRLLTNGLLKSIEVGAPLQSAVAGLRDRKDPYLWAGRTADSSFSGALWASQGIGNAYDRVVGDRAYYLTLRSRVLRAFAESRHRIGLSAEFDNAYSSGGHVQLLGLDPRFDGDWPHRLANNAVGAWHHEAWVSYAARQLRVDFGTGSMNYGPAVTDALVLRSDAPEVTQLRVQAGPPSLRFLTAFGWLTPPPLTGIDTLQTSGGYPLIMPRKAQRWVAMHRLTWSPSPRVTVSAHEMMVFGGPLDPRLMIPVFPLALLTNDDETENVGNGLVGADLTLRPIDGTELFASVLLDHINLGSLVQLVGVGKQQLVKQAVSVGVEQRLPGDVRLGLGYLRADPFIYTHWTRLAAWEVEGISLGAAAGPNSDEMSVRLTRWFPFRTRVMVGMRKLRKGLNPIDAAGAVTTDVGGDLQLNVNGFGPFLRGADVQSHQRVEFELESEPLRGFKVTLRKSGLRAVQGTRIPSREGTTFVRLSFGL